MLELLKDIKDAILAKVVEVLDLIKVKVSLALEALMAFIVAKYELLKGKVKEYALKALGFLGRLV